MNIEFILSQGFLCKNTSEFYLKMQRSLKLCKWIDSTLELLDLWYLLLDFRIVGQF